MTDTPGVHDRIALDTYQAIADLHLKVGIIISNQNRAESDRQETNIRLSSLEKSVNDYRSTAEAFASVKATLHKTQATVEELVLSRTRTAALVGAMRWVIGGISGVVAASLSALITWYLTGGRTH